MHFISILLNIVTFTFFILVVRPQLASGFTPTASRRKFAIPFVVCLVLVGLVHISMGHHTSSNDSELSTQEDSDQDSSPDRNDYIRVWSQAKNVLQRAQADGQNPACSEIANSLYQVMVSSENNIKQNEGSQNWLDASYRQGAQAIQNSMQNAKMVCGF